MPVAAVRQIPGIPLVAGIGDGFSVEPKTGGTGGDFSTNTSSVTPGQLVVFADGTGKLGGASAGDGILTLTGGVSGLIADNSGDWNSAFSDRMKWDGGATGLVAATGRTSLGLGTAAQSNVGAFEVPLTFQQSLTRATNTINLVGDNGSPGASKYYGTDSGSTKGFFSVPILSVFTRTGAIVATTGDYTAAQVTNAVSTLGSYADPGWITGLAWSKVSGRPTTLSGYGVTDAQPLDSDLTAIASLTTDAFGRGLLPLTTASAVRTYIGAGTSSFDGTFASLTSKPTTLVGYGITDAQPLDADLTAIAAVASQTAYGRGFLPLVDAAGARTYIGAQVAGSYAAPATTLAGYGITDAYTKTTSDSLYAPVAHTHTFASLTSRPTTLSGYGITDAEPALGNPGTSGYVLSSTTGGVRSWVAPSAGGSGSPGGSDTQIQFNDASAFGGDAGLVYNKTTDALTFAGNLYGSTLNNAGAPAVPQYSFSGQTSTGLYFGANGNGWAQGGIPTVQFSSHLTLDSPAMLGWAVRSNWLVFGAMDIALGRNAAGILELNNGTAGQFRDLKCRNIDFTGTITGAGIGGGSGNVANTGTPTSGQYARWTAATVIEGVAASTVKTDLALNNVTNDAQIKSSDFPASSVDGEISLFSGTGGKAQKRATGTGVVTVLNGVFSASPSVRVTPRVASVASSATPVVNSDNTDIADLLALAINVTSMSSSLTGTPNNGDRLIYRIKDNGTTKSLIWGGSFANSQALLPTATVPNKVTTVYLLRDTAKGTWECLGVDVEDAVFGSYQGAMLSPTGTGSTTGVMMGFAGTITPGVTGKICIMACGSLNNNNASGATTARLRYGTGTAPVNGAALTGTLTAARADRTATTANFAVPFALMAVVTGLVVGTAYWLDLDIIMTGTGTANALFSSICAYEIP